MPQNKKHTPEQIISKLRKFEQMRVENVTIPICARRFGRNALCTSILVSILTGCGGGATGNEHAKNESRRLGSLQSRIERQVDGVDSVAVSNAVPRSVVIREDEDGVDSCSLEKLSRMVFDEFDEKEFLIVIEDQGNVDSLGCNTTVKVKDGTITRSMMLHLARS